MVEYVLFDVDNTLYPRSCGLLQRVDARINRFMVEQVGAGSETVDEQRRAYRDACGSTLKGLMTDYGTDPEEYIAFVHDVPVEELIPPNPQLDRTLGAMELHKAIFTNGPMEYSARILKALGIQDRFGWRFDLRFVGFSGKPHPSAYEKVLGALGAGPEVCALVEDSPANLLSARKLGMRTVLVGGSPADWVDAHIGAIEQVAQVAFLRG